ncbi:MAG: Gfo/Idh/MocA family oxidoreductase [Planctomycetes bacterium]|nr:Gfo/Idh/MocA family oxidoreductase [Planctomycetota bacterium]
MKFLVIGLGSMGKRRVRNLRCLGEKDVIGFDLKEDTRKESEEKYNIKTFRDIDKAMAENPDVLVISTPPNHHIEYELLAVKNKKHFFCEAGIFTEKVDEVKMLAEKNHLVAAPSCTFRFNSSVKKIKELVEKKRIGKLIAMTYHMGQYLPDWHPWEDITDFYVGQKETAATREMVPFELEWLTWIMGEIKEISCIRGKVSNLEADIDDVYQLIFRFDNNAIGNLLIEVVSRTPLRILRIIGEGGTIVWDWLDDTVRLYEAKTKKWKDFKEEKGFKEKGYLAKENMYIEEIRNFVNAIKGKEKYIYTINDDMKILYLLRAAEKAANDKKHIIMKTGDEFGVQK